MSTSAQRSARAALDAARPAVARLESSRSSEDLAADLIEIWDAVEAALRTLVGTTALAGQALIREARQRQMISFDQANGIAEFEAVHARLQDTSYRPTTSDSASARNAYLKLDGALMETAAQPVGYGATGAAAAPPSPTAPVAETAVTTPVRRGTPRWLIPAVAVLIIVLGVGGFFVFRGGDGGSYAEGVDAYTKGQREVATNAFNKAIREDPKNPGPHIYLARMAREVGNFTLATSELTLALDADPNNPTALREMGANMLQQNNAEMARRFYVRAIQADPTDKVSQGYLGCALLRLNRITDATTFLNRAGQGPWSSCVASAAQPQAPQVPPGASIPR
jgi:tetratricopeptide (TPR) repeat protein